MHPPTPISFVRNFTSLLEESGCLSITALQVEESAQFLTELSVYDDYFVAQRSSATGLGAILIALDTCEQIISLCVRQSFLNRVLSIFSMDSTSKEIQECKHHLYTIYLRNTDLQ